MGKIPKESEQSAARAQKKEMGAEQASQEDTRSLWRSHLHKATPLNTRISEREAPRHAATDSEALRQTCMRATRAPRANQRAVATISPKTKIPRSPETISAAYKHVHVHAHAHAQVQVQVHAHVQVTCTCTCQKMLPVCWAKGSEHTR